jgi:photosystem II stability/assembly factor-like uncharacterized protein
MSRHTVPVEILIVLVLAGCGSPQRETVPTAVLEPSKAISPAATDTPQAHVPTVAVETAAVFTASPSQTATVDASVIRHLAPGAALSMTQVHMVDPLSGWGVGGVKQSGVYDHVLRTTDGGSSWMDVTPAEPATAATDSAQAWAKGFFTDADTAWVTYHAAIPSQVPQNPVVWRTMDGGRTWTPSAPLDTTGLEVYSVSDVVFSGPTGWLLVHVGAGMNHDYVVLYRSSDGGANWTRLLDPYDDGGIQSCTKTGILFVNKGDGWLTGNCNGVAPGVLLFQTSNGGKDWQTASLPAPADHKEMFTSMDYACGIRSSVAYAEKIFLGVECEKYTESSPATLAYLYFTSDNGMEWADYPYPGGDFYTIDGSTGWALGKDIQQTTDGGKSWNKLNTVSITWNGQLDFLSALLGFGIAEKDSEYGLIRTTNGGGIWDLLSPVVAPGP